MSSRFRFSMTSPKHAKRVSQDREPLHLSTFQTHKPCIQDTSDLGCLSCVSQLIHLMADSLKFRDLDDLLSFHGLELDLLDTFRSIARDV